MKILGNKSFQAIIIILAVGYIVGLLQDPFCK
jgi:hypothetical protein